MKSCEFARGVNLGGWLSQYGSSGKDHFDTFIQETDLERIAGWGLDHVRLPVDYPVFLDERTGEFREDGLAYLDRCIAWASRRNLGVVLDLHAAPGYSFGTLAENRLFTDEPLQQRFIQIWRLFAERYRSEGAGLQFELLNEVVDENSARWNRLAHRAIAAIRAIDGTRRIIYGGNFFNSIDELKNLDLVEHDDNIVYTFHMYKPMVLTHQKASWVPFLKAYNQTVEYPGEPANLQEFLDSHGEIQDTHTKEFIPEKLDKPLMERMLQPASEFLAKTGKPLYCGEFGVIDQAPVDSRIRWHRDVTELLAGMGIGYAVWSYKAMNFGLVDGAGRVASEELVRVLAGQ